MNQITVMAIVAMMASLWGYSNAGIKISSIVEYLIIFENQYKIRLIEFPKNFHIFLTCAFRGCRFSP